MPAKAMEVNISGEYVELRREQWRGHTARITNDPELLEEVKKYTWTYYVLSCKLDAPVPCRLDAPDFDVARWGSADCLHQHQQVI